MPRRTEEEEKKILQGWDSLEKAIVEAEILMRGPTQHTTEYRIVLQKIITFYHLEHSK